MNPITVRIQVLEKKGGCAVIDFVRIADGKIVDNKPLQFNGIEAVCPHLCVAIPVDIRYGKFSLMTCVNVVPTDLLGMMFPKWNLIPKVRSLDYAFVFQSIIKNGNGPTVLDEELVFSISSVIQSRREGAEPCTSCARYERCILLARR